MNHREALRVLEIFDERTSASSQVFIAGGAAAAIATGTPIAGDIDIFIIGDNVAKEPLELLYAALGGELSTEVEAPEMSYRDCVLLCRGKIRDQEVQVLEVAPQHDITSLLNAFDSSICRVAVSVATVDKEPQIICTPDFTKALINRTIMNSFEKPGRIEKYRQRFPTFTVTEPEYKPFLR